MSSMTKISYPIADHSRLQRTDSKLLVIRPDGTINHDLLEDLDQFLETGDTIVVNNSATIPASFYGIHEYSGKPIELRLAYSLSTDPTDLTSWMAIIYGEGDWTIPTEEREEAPDLKAGDILIIAHELIVEIISISSLSRRLIEIKFALSNGKLWDKIYQLGKPIQYSYLKEDLYLWDQQTIFSGPPVSIEAPSASFQLSWGLILKLRSKGINVVTLTHAISISNTGDANLDSLLPLPERYWIAESAAATINQAHQGGRRIIAIGTSVTRALESSAQNNNGTIMPGTFQTNLKITKDHQLQIVDGLLTGMHVPGESHVNLLESFIPKGTLEDSYDQAISRDYIWHEYGDLSLIFKQR